MATISTKEKERQADPSIPCAAYQYMAPKWHMIETLLGGTAAMREAGAEFLPMHPAEGDSSWQSRLDQNILYNVTELTLNSLVGRVFREEMKLGEDVPQEITDLADNIDLQKNNISSFCQNWLSESIAKGFSHVMVDMPGIDPEEKPKRTLADDAAENQRPFWALIKPENLIFAYYENIYGEETLIHARIVESKCTMTGFAEYTRTQIRVLEPGLWELWEDENEGTRKKPNWLVVGSGPSDLNKVPIVTFYANRKGALLAKPPLEDLAHLNVRHWQSTSDQINVLTVARFPMLAASGTVQEAGKENLAIGPRQLLTMRDPSGRFYYVEHSGKAIASGQEDLEKLEDMMAAYGAEFVRRQIAGRTAFERAADTGEAISPLKDMALRFQVAVKSALDLTAEWLDLPDNKGGSVIVNTDFTEENLTSAPLNALADARKRGDISRKTWLKEMKRQGVVDSDLDIEAEVAEIKREMEEGPHPPTFFVGQEQMKGPFTGWDHIEAPEELQAGQDPTAAAATAGKPKATTPQKMVKASSGRVNTSPRGKKKPAKTAAA